MYLEQLEYLLQISKHKSIASASTIVHLTPQALSLSIKRLEEELQVSLLTRTSKGVFLTEEGKELVEISSRFFEDLSKFQNKKNTAPITEDIYFLTSQEEHGSILLPILCDLYRQYPQINFFQVSFMIFFITEGCIQFGSIGSVKSYAQKYLQTPAK